MSFSLIFVILNVVYCFMFYCFPIIWVFVSFDSDSFAVFALFSNWPIFKILNVVCNFALYDALDFTLCTFNKLTLCVSSFTSPRPAPAAWLKKYVITACEAAST